MPHCYTCYKMQPPAIVVAWSVCVFVCRVESEGTKYHSLGSVLDPQWEVALLGIILGHVKTCHS